MSLSMRPERDDRTIIKKQKKDDSNNASRSIHSSSSSSSLLLPPSSSFHGCRSIEEYQQINFISQGTYGMVFKASCIKTGKIYAIKQIKASAQQTNKVGFSISALREINILLALNHPNIIKVHEMCVGSTMDKIYMVMDYCQNDLKACIELSKPKLPFSTGEVKQILVQLLSALDCMHKKWFIHRDLKTSNLLYNNNGILKVCDYGMARKYGDPIKAYTLEVVTLWYRCPEVLLGSPTYTTSLDVWSVGCIFAELILGKPLFPGEGEVDQINKIVSALGNPTEDKWKGCSSLPNYNKINWRASSYGKLREMLPMLSISSSTYLDNSGYSLLTMLLSMNPDDRITAADALMHPWLQSEAPFPSALNMMPSFKLNS